MSLLKTVPAAGGGCDPESMANATDILEKDKNRHFPAGT